MFIGQFFVNCFTVFEDYAAACSTWTPVNRLDIVKCESGALFMESS